MGWLPLHQLVMRHGYAQESLRLLIRFYPEAVRARTADGWLPLHLLCRYHGAANESAAILLEEWPEAVYEMNGDGWLALHLLARYAGAYNETLHALMNSGPNTARRETGNEGWLPLHFLVYFHPTSFTGLKSLIDVYPKAASLKARIKGSCPNLRLSNSFGGSGGDETARHHGLPSDFGRHGVKSELSNMKVDEYLLPLHMLLSRDVSSLESFRLLLSTFPEALLSLPRALGSRALSMLCARSTSGEERYGRFYAPVQQSMHFESICTGSSVNETLQGRLGFGSLIGNDECASCSGSVLANQSRNGEAAQNMRQLAKGRDIVSYLVLAWRIWCTCSIWTKSAICFGALTLWRLWGQARNGLNSDGADSDGGRARRGKGGFKKKDRPARGASSGADTRCESRSRATGKVTVLSAQRGSSAAPEDLRSAAQPAKPAAGEREKDRARNPAGPVEVSSPKPRRAAQNRIPRPSLEQSAATEAVPEGRSSDELWRTVGAVPHVKTEKIHPKSSDAVIKAAAPVMAAAPSASAGVRGPKAAGPTEPAQACSKSAGRSVPKSTRGWETKSDAAAAASSANAAVGSTATAVPASVAAVHDERCTLQGPTSEGGSSAGSVSSSRPQTPLSSASGSPSAGDFVRTIAASAGSAVVSVAAKAWPSGFPRCAAGPVECAPPESDTGCSVATTVGNPIDDCPVSAPVAPCVPAPEGCSAGLDGCSAVSPLWQLGRSVEPEDVTGVAVLPSGLLDSEEGAADGRCGVTGGSPAAPWVDGFVGLLDLPPLGQASLASGPVAGGAAALDGVGPLPVLAGWAPAPAPCAGGPAPGSRASRRFPVALREDVQVADDL